MKKTISRRSFGLLMAQIGASVFLNGCRNESATTVESEPTESVSEEIEQTENATAIVEDDTCWLISTVTRNRLGETARSEFVYDVFGNRTAMLYYLDDDPDPVRYEWDYDEYGNVVASYVVDDSGARQYPKEYENTLDSHGLVLRATNEYGEWTDYEYYLNGGLKSRSINQLGSSEDYTYDEDGWIVEYTYNSYSGDDEGSADSFYHIGEPLVQQYARFEYEHGPNGLPNKMTLFDEYDDSEEYHVDWDENGNLSELGTEAQGFEYTYTAIDNPSTGALCTSMRKPNVLFPATI